MAKVIKFLLVKSLLIFPLFIFGCSILGANSESLKLTFKEPIHFNLSDLEYVKQQLEKEDNIYQEAYTRLLIEANKALNSNGYSVITKAVPTPNGDKNVYVSRAPYWWPNPNTKDGLPYIRKDGRINPEVYQFDRSTLISLKKDIQALSIIYYLTDQEKYSAKAISLVKKWFITDETEMKPHLKFAQGIPGRTAGRAEGIIDGVYFYQILNYIPILKKSNHWTGKITVGINNWYYSYYVWLLTHPFGESAKNKINNHGTWYDVQIATYAYFFDDIEKLNKIFYRVQEKRIPEQVSSNGKQSHELNRTKPLEYSIYNLTAFSILAKLATKIQYNLLSSTNSSKGIWAYNSNGSERGSIENAIRFLLPAIKDNYTCSMLPILKRAYNYSKKEEYFATYKHIIENNPSCRNSTSLILYPIKK